MKFIKSRFVPPKLIGKTLDVSKATVTDQNILAKEKASQMGDRAFRETLSRFYPKIDIAAAKRVKAKRINNVKNKVTKLQEQAYNLANIKQSRAYSKMTNKLGIEKSYRGLNYDEADVLRSKVNTDARVNVMDSENVSSANFLETSYVYEKKAFPKTSQFAEIELPGRKKPIKRQISSQDLKFGIDPKTSKITKKQRYVSEDLITSSGVNIEKQKVYNFHKVNKPNINFNKQSFGQTTSGKIVLGKKLGDVSNKYNRTRNFKRSFSRFKITPKE